MCQFSNTLAVNCHPGSKPTALLIENITKHYTSSMYFVYVSTKEKKQNNPDKKIGKRNITLPL